MTIWGKVDWSKIKTKKEMNHIEEIKKLDEFREFYVIWMDIELPILKVSRDTFLNNSSDILAVSFDTWLLSEDYKKVIEIHHEDEITIGII